MRNVLRFGKGCLKVVLLGVALIGTLVMNLIGAIVCAITE